MPKRLTRKGQPTQTTEKGLEIPVPKRKSVFDLLNRAATKRAEDAPSERGKGRRRTSRGR